MHLLALAVGGVSPLLLMVAYGLAVAVALIGVTYVGLLRCMSVLKTASADTRSTYPNSVV